MDKDEFLKVMGQVADIVPDQATPEVVSVIIANLIRLYDQQEEWPQMITIVTTVLADVCEERAEQETAATEDAKTFLKTIMENHYD
tara:strand:+ start:569 stop:826 length:258 start_codon:yes stop_codon:yes gene_type:complete